MAPVADLLRERLGTFPAAERKVARVLLADYPDAAYQTLAVLSARAGVSAPTVIRLINHLGYRGFPDFQRALRSESADRQASPLDLYPRSSFIDAADQGSSAVIAHSSGAITAAVSATLQTIPPGELAAAITLVSDVRRRVMLAGGRFTDLIAQYLGLHLTQMRPDVITLPLADVARASILATLGRRDTLVLFDSRRYETQTETLARMARRRGAKIVLFTDQWLSPAAQFADVVLNSRVEAASPYDTLVPVFALVEIVVTGALAVLGDSALEWLNAGEQAAREAGLYGD